jgi:site-specific recombinase XerD
MAVSANDFFCYKDDYLEYRQQIYQISDQTLKSNRTDLTLFENFINSSDHTDITGPAVIDFQYHLKQERNNCGNSINRKLFCLKSYEKYLKLFDVHSAETLPFDNVLKIRTGYRNRPDALTSHQISHLFSTIDANTVLGLRDYAVYALMYQLGLRVGEVHTLDLDHLDIEKQQIQVMGKGRKTRALHMNDELIKILCDFIAVRGLFLNSRATRALFVSKKGNRLAIRTMEDNLKKLLQRANLKAPFNVTCHSLRHSMASHLNDKGTDILVIQSILGHATTRSTEPYIHPSADRVRMALEKLPAIKYVKELILSGELDLNFQTPFKLKKE